MADIKSVLVESDVPISEGIACKLATFGYEAAWDSFMSIISDLANAEDEEVANMRMSPTDACKGLLMALRGMRVVDVALFKGSLTVARHSRAAEETHMTEQ